MPFENTELVGQHGGTDWFASAQFDSSWCGHEVQNVPSKLLYHHAFAVKH